MLSNLNERQRNINTSLRAAIHNPPHRIPNTDTTNHSSADMSDIQRSINNDVQELHVRLQNLSNTNESNAQENITEDVQEIFVRVIAIIFNVFIIVTNLIAVIYQNLQPEN